MPRKYLMTKNKLNIALIGYGKMGKIIEKVAIQRGHNVVLTISSSNRSLLNSDSLKEVDVAIEFTNPISAAENLIILAANKVPTICGTTAWLERYEEVSQAFVDNKAGFLYASNFSIGVNIFFAINKQLAKLMAAQTDYNIDMTESHHLTKKDAPSGTAVTIAQQILAEVKTKNNWSIENSADQDIKIKVVREEDVKGMHEVRYTSTIDSISIKHEAHTREGFALGAVLAAEYLDSQKAGIYNMSDVLGL